MTKEGRSPGSLLEIFYAVIGGDSGMASVAMRLAGVGVPVFPMLEIGGQLTGVPIPGRQDEYFTLHDATEDPEKIERMFSIPRVGVAAHWKACDLVVVDVDRHNADKDGFATFEELVGHDAREDGTVVVTRRGVHLLRAIPPDGEFMWRSGVAAGIDLLGFTLVAAPPGWKRSYDWSVPLPGSLAGSIPELWPVLADLARVAPQQPRTPYVPTVRVPSDGGRYSFDDINHRATRDNYAAMFGVDIPSRGNFPCPLDGHSHGGSAGGRSGQKEASVYEDEGILFFKCFGQHAGLGRMPFLHTANAVRGRDPKDTNAMQVRAEEWGAVLGAVRSVPAAPLVTQPERSSYGGSYDPPPPPPRTPDPSPSPPRPTEPTDEARGRPRPEPEERETEHGGGPPDEDKAEAPAGDAAAGSAEAGKAAVHVQELLDGAESWRVDPDDADENEPPWPELDASFWGRHAVYDDIRAEAIAAKVPPGAALGAVLAVRSGQMPPELRLAPYIEAWTPAEQHRLGASRGESLALFVTLVANPRVGKGLVTKFALDRMPRFPVMEEFPVSRTPSSGEGLLAVFLRGAAMPGGGMGTPPSNAIVVFEEAGLMQQISDRKGSTLKEWLKAVYSNSALRTDAGNAQYSRTVEWDAYSLGVIVNATIPKSRFLLDVSTGFGSRFLAFPVADRALSQMSFQDWRAAMRDYVEKATTRRRTGPLRLPEGLVLNPSDGVKEQIHNMHVVRYNGGGVPGISGDPLVRHKVAGLLGSLKAQWDGTPWLGASESDWNDASEVVGYCESVLRAVEKASSIHQFDETRETGLRLGQEDIARRLAREEIVRQLQRAAATMTRKAQAKAPVGITRSELARAPNSRDATSLRSVYGQRWVSRALRLAQDAQWLVPSGAGKRWVPGPVSPPPRGKPGRRPAGAAGGVQTALPLQPETVSG